MLRTLFGGRDEASSSTGAAASSSSGRPATLLVIQMDDYDWPAIFRGCRLRDGRAIRVVQTGWDCLDVHCDTYSKAGFMVEVSKLAPTASVEDDNPQVARLRAGGTRNITVQPDFVLVRNEVKMPHFDGRSRLDGFLFADVPSVNSLLSILTSCERPAVQGQLHRLQRRLGHEAFPVVPSHFASSHRSFMYGYTFPAVVKVGSAHAGAGKMKIQDHHQMSDFKSVLQMMPEEHCFAEPFINGALDLRIQKIGSHIRAFRRTGVSGEWKTNTGTAIMEQIELTDRYRLWVESASEMFGGLDILAVDAIVEEGTGKEYILEVNGTSIGLHPDYAAEDNQHIRDLVLQRMNDALCDAA